MIARGPFQSHPCTGSLKYAGFQDHILTSCYCSAPLSENNRNCAVPNLVLNLVLGVLDAKSTFLKLSHNMQGFFLVLNYLSLDFRLFQMLSVPESHTAPPDILFAFLFLSENVKTLQRRYSNHICGMHYYYYFSSTLLNSSILL